MQNIGYSDYDIQTFHDGDFLNWIGHSTSCVNADKLCPLEHS